MAKISLSYPDTGLTISISVKNRDTGVEVFSDTMTEVGTTKVYTYDFTEVVDTDYIYVATVSGYSDMSGVIYRDGGGLTTEEHLHLMDLMNSTGGMFSIDYKYINSHTTRKINELNDDIDAKINSIPKISLENIEKSINENNSQIELAKDNIIDRINESEIELRNDVRTTKSELKEDNVSTRNLIRQKAEKIDKNVSKLVDRQDLTDKTIEDEADKIEDEIEKILEEEADMIENEIYNKEADEIEQELNSNQQTDGTEKS